MAKTKTAEADAPVAPAPDDPQPDMEETVDAPDAAPDAPASDEPAPAAPQPMSVMMVETDQQQRIRVAAEVMRLRKAGIRLDETVPGGRYKHPDGRWHDAENRPLK